MKIKSGLLIIALLILIKSNSGAQSTTTDTTCVNTNQLRKVYADAAVRPLLDSQILILNTRITGLEYAIRLQNVMDSATVASYNKELSIRLDQNKVLLDDNAALRRSLRWQKTKADLFGGGLLAAIVYLGVKVFFK